MKDFNHKKAKKLQKTAFCGEKSSWEMNKYLKMKKRLISQVEEGQRHSLDIIRWTVCCCATYILGIKIKIGIKL